MANIRVVLFFKGKNIFFSFNKDMSLDENIILAKAKLGIPFENRVFLINQKFQAEIDNVNIIQQDDILNIIVNPSQPNPTSGTVWIFITLAKAMI